MLWTVLIFLLLCAIGAVLWLHYRQEQDWRQELTHMEGGAEEDGMPSETPAPGKGRLNLVNPFGSAQTKAAYSKTIARLRLLKVKQPRRSEALPSEPEAVLLDDYEDGSSGFSGQDNFENTFEAETQTEQEVSKTAAPQPEQTPRAPSVARKRLQAKPPVYPDIVPFVESEEPEYVPRPVSGAAYEEITLEEATRALGEAAMQEAAVEKSVQCPVVEPAPNVAEPQVQHTLKTSDKPMPGLEIIGFNDPALRRTRDRVLAGVSEIHIAQAQAPHIESVQTALKIAEREAVIPVADIPSRWDEIDVGAIQSNLARQTAARHRLAAAVAPVRDFQPQVIQDDEILANLSHTPAARRRSSRPIRHVDVSGQESVIPPAARVEQSAAKLQPKKPFFPPKTSRFQSEPYISRPAAPTATVVEPPAVPQTQAAPIDIPEPPAFKEPPQLVLPEAEVHVSNRPQRSIHDFLISESALPETADAVPLQTASTDNPAQDEATMAVFEHRPQAAVAPVAAPSETAAAATQADTLFWPSENPAESAAAVNHDENTVEANSSISNALAEPAVIQTVSAALVPSHTEAAVVGADTSDVHLPSVDLLLPPQYDPSAAQTDEALLENSIIIEEKLAEFKVKVKVVDAYAGPVITRYEIEPDVGVRGNAVLNLEKDLARSLGVASIRVVETIPGKTCMGLELPNPKRQIIRLSEIFKSPAFTESKSKLTLALGQDITGQPVVANLAKAPHLLVAGTTGSGKSVGVNAMILSMLFKATPEEVRMIMIDPKMLELSIYEGIPHLLAPVVTDMKLAANALNWCVNEMEKRYRLMSHVGVRNLAGFNEKVAETAKRGEKIANPFSLTPDNPEPLEKLPFIVVVVDEFADLMMTAGKKIEELIARLAQKARAAGIHLILATQRPSVDVITGLIKANIPTRIAFQVSSKIDSRTILDQMGAENLLGMGDMLFLPPGTGYPQRVHGAFASDDEVHNVVEYLKQFGEPDYVDEILSGGSGGEEFGSIGRNHDSDVDPMYDEAVAYVVKSRKASISGVQRQLRIGYNRAARLIDQMENDGIVSPPETNGNRTVLAPDSNHLD
ncbi:DNA translocase FtsK [Neisseria perflava]|uniref:DNA translocase FtsK n=1 Tax=Neisseria perflava TaxID=33053 RepID=UPI0020A01A82|nr:DNA translocase FtsK [Neisseria perflava]MCP1661224.1 S-DNA-T family DNA segregation ATPase FtsK/SpoIIIE [Neisseria perflava]